MVLRKDFILRDRRALRILEVLDAYKDLTFRKIHELTKKEMSKTTLKRIIEELIEEGFVTVEKHKRQGQPDKYNITDYGREILRKNISTTAFSIVEITFSKEFLRTVSKETIEKINEVLVSPEKRNMLSRLLGSLFVAFVEGLHEKPSFTVSFLKDGKMVFSGILPRKWSLMLKEIVDSGIVKNEIQLFNYIVSLGSQMLIEVYKAYRKGNLTENKYNIQFYAFKLNKEGKVEVEKKVEVIKDLVIKNLCR